jgi:glycosyltransferase involved in cell wall biosynthesis
MDRSLRRAVVVASTAATVRDLMHNHHLEPERATIVPLGVDLDLFNPSAERPVARPYFFHLASSDDRDRTDLIVRAFERYRSDHLDGALLVIGGRLGIRAGGLEKLVEELGVGDVTIFRGGVRDDELAELYAGALATVQASPDEGFGLQPLEAMACGSLLIATPAAAVKEVTDGGMVLWSDPHVETMADVMRQVDDHPELARKASHLNRQQAEHYSWDRTARALHDILTTV